MLLDPIAARELEDVLFGQVRGGRELEVIEVLEQREAGGADAYGDGVGESGPQREQLQRADVMMCAGSSVESGFEIAADRLRTWRGVASRGRLAA